MQNAMRLRAMVLALLSAAAATALGAEDGRASAAAAVLWETTRWSDAGAIATRSDGSGALLTLDRELQTKARRLLREAMPQAGAAVVVDVRTSEVLALVEIGENAQSLLFSPAAPAASLFKLVTTATLYENTRLTPRSRVCTNGGVRRIDREHLEAARGPNARCTAFGSALGFSRNAVFAQLAVQELMREDLVQMADALGFNRRLPFDVNAQLGSLEVPYDDLEFARTAVGFQNSRLSALGGAQLALTVAHDGEVRPLHVVREANAAAPAEGSLPESRRAFSAKTAERMRRMMEVTVQSGTSRDAFSDERGRPYLGSIRVAGKTGTLRPDEEGPTSSWFVGFAPSARPEVVVSVLLLNRAKWHRKANEVARDVLRTYFAARGASGVTAPP